MQLTKKMAELFDIVERNLSEASNQQKRGYYTTTKSRSQLCKGDRV